ncbi:SNF1-interacting protein [Saxophila tyrrhenica]|uniref:SNF1-interacting protein n=1 Tax=Saxophila tyrrhenica TaxID=1690608 RepID=A0AAV9PLK8_9PEZI|nr:SNF1-interacting protein [Saxophila tyrrhenica]
MAEGMSQTSLKPVEQPLNLIPVGLKEAALDSPTFRATALHFSDQIDVIERWLDGYVKAASRLVTEMSALETAVNNLITQSAPPAQVSEAVLDHDYTLLALRRYGEGAREYWNSTLRGVKKYDGAVIEPIKAFLNSELRAFKDARRTLDTTQKGFDSVIARYLSQGKAKEASSLREDAFQVHEARKSYLRASMDFCISAPQLRASLDQLIVKVFSEQFREMRVSRDSSAAVLTRLNAEMERVRGWSREMEDSEKAFKRELSTARKQIEESANLMTRPSRELHDYEVSTVPYLGTKASTAAGMTSPAKTPQQLEKGEKQGWLFLKTVVGKPARTVWSRRWFFVKNGIFGWLIQGSRSGGVEESEKIGVLLCGVRPAFQEDRRFCFEVKTKDTSIVLQAETQGELSEWISSFEVAKRKALEDPGSTESSPLAADPAFAITAPIAPEFAARLDDRSERGTTEDLPGALALPDRDGAGFGGVGQRASFDVSAARRVTSLGGESERGERSRDHAARIMSKLDLHKSSSAAPPPVQSPTPAGGIASLISASHNVLPIRPDTPSQPGPETTSGHRRNPTIPSSTLAPSTLANPPAPTNLSHTAVVVSGERGLGLGSKADGAGMPSGIMANLWGSSNWGYVNRLGDDLAKPVPHQSSVSQPPSPRSGNSVTMDDMSVMDGTGELSQELSSGAPQVPGQLGHRKTISAVAASDLSLPSKVSKPAADDGEDYPNYYPLPLKAQHAQFRMLFPSVPRSEKVVLVFRGTWNPNEQQDFPGRIYVTAKDIYFYSHHLGFVLITGVSLSSISEVTAAPGRDCDFLYLHLKESSRQDRRRITIRVFLDSLRLLQRRLSFLVENASSETSWSLEEVLKKLIKLEMEKQERSSSIESWEDLADEAVGGDEGSPYRRERNVKASLRIDGNLYAETAKTGREVQRFQLPRQPVVYAPQGMQASTTREFNVSAKALFHIMFGDKSAVFQLLYCNRWADTTSQTPWTKSADFAAGHWTRKFASRGEATPMADSQTIDILNDHLCYVVSNLKHPWRLPYSSRFHLTTKFVITHVAKSSCKLAIFQQITWTSPPAMTYIKNLIEQRALQSLEADALDLTNVAMDQVTKLGKQGKTNKAIEIFGNIGQQGPVPAVDVSAVPNLGGTVTSQREKSRQPVSITKLVAADLLVRVGRALGYALDVFFALAKGLIDVCTSHTLLVALLIASMLYNSWYGYRDGLVWFHERSATRYMARLGVKPEPIITKAVYLSDIEDFVAPPSVNETSWPFSLAEKQSNTNNCKTTFGEQVLSPATSMVGSGARMKRSRDAMARYRHDLLVALRVVNRIERDVVQAEWEDWVRGEGRKCDRVEQMLVVRQQKQSGKGKKADRKVDGELGPEFKAYCDSCRDELAAVGAGAGLI